MSGIGPTSFFEQQDLARRNSHRLIWMFGFSVLAVVTALNVIVAVMLFSSGEGEGPEVDPGSLTLALGMTTLGTSGLIGLASVGKTMSLSAGGSVIAESLGGRLIEPQDVKDFHEKRLLNVVEEMAIASGVPVPPVYVMDNEEGINAFAAGHRPTDAVIGVTRGTLTTLTRDQLQGVIAHEFSHILNGDMRLNIRMMGLLYGLLFLSMMGQMILRVMGNVRSTRRSRDDSKGDPTAVILVVAVALYILGYLGYFLGRLIQASLSRQREYLADASAVQFTRNPDGIAGALKAIGGWSQHAVVQHPESIETAHMFFSEAISRLSSHSPFATHPPLDDRIRRLDPHWDGVFPAPQAIEQDAAADATGSEKKNRRGPLDLPGFPGMPGGVSIPPIVAGLADAHATDRPVGELRAGLDRSLDSVGRPGAEQFQYARAFLDSLPADVENLAHEPLSASCIVLWLLSPQQDQIDELPAIFRGEYQRVAATMPDELRPFPVDIIKLLAPALRHLSGKQMADLVDTTERLIMADSKVLMREWLVRRLLLNQVRRSRDPFLARFRPVRGPIRDVETATAILASAVAWSGHSLDSNGRSESDVVRCMQAAAEIMRPVMATFPDQPLPRSEIGAERLDSAIARLWHESAPFRLALIRASAAMIESDAVVTPREFDLVRVIADSLDCPLPPIQITVA
jgi:Zn-dependent protease with chaperone function